MSGDTEVGEFFKKLNDPLKPALQAVRTITLTASPKISEGIKWNTASFRTTEWFFTISIRKGEVLGILHRGAKLAKGAKPEIADPAGLLEWLGKDRAAVRFKSLTAVTKNKGPLTKILRAWICYVK